MRALSAAALALGLLGCGLGGGGAEIGLGSFPQSGLGPYRLMTAEDLPALDAPYLLQAPGIDVAEIAAEAADDSDRLRLWLGARPLKGGPYIGRAEAPRLEDGAGDSIEVALAPTLPWEGDRIGSPSVLRDLPDLPPYVLVYLGGLGGVGTTGAVGLAVSGDGVVFERPAPGPLLTAAALGEEPRAVAAFPVGDELHLYLVAGAAGPLIRARAPLSALGAFVAGGAAPPFRVERLPLFAADFPVAVSSTETAPAEALVSVAGRALLTPAGRPRYDLFVTASAKGDMRRALCAAASYDGERFLPVSDPLLSRTAGQILGGVALSYRHRALLLLGLTSVRGGVAAARIP